MNRGYYMVRAMGQTEEEFRIFFDNSVVAVGWSRVDFTKFSNDISLIEEVDKEYYSDNRVVPQVVGKARNEVRRFKNIKEGDYIIVPHWDSVCLAVAQGEEVYSKEHYDRDLANQRKVVYHKNQEGEIIFIPRYKLSEGLQRRLRVRGTTVADLREFANEIEELLKGEDFDVRFALKRERKIQEFKKTLLENIQSGKTNLQAGGYGLEKLVRELLEIEGYDARILSKRKFPGFSDADIEAIKVDFLTSEKLLVQVKHHSGISGTWGAQQLIGILNSDQEYKEYKLVLVTSGKPSTDLCEVCKDNDIILISGEELVEWIYRSLPNMKFETKKRLGISDVPEILS